MLVEGTTLLYSIDHSGPKNNFTITVVPINEVGAGEPALLTIARGNLVVPVEVELLHFHKQINYVVIILIINLVHLNRTY